MFLSRCDYKNTKNKFLSEALFFNCLACCFQLLFFNEYGRVTDALVKRIWGIPF